MAPVAGREGRFAGRGDAGDLDVADLDRTASPSALCGIPAGCLSDDYLRRGRLDLRLPVAAFQVILCLIA